MTNSSQAATRYRLPGLDFIGRDTAKVIDLISLKEINLDFWQLYGEATKTVTGFFWKTGWAFVMGYWISAMIQAFVAKGRLTPYMGDADLKSVSLATI